MKLNPGPMMVNPTSEECWGGKAEITAKQSVDKARTKIVAATLRNLRKNGYKGTLTADDLTWISEGNWIQGYITRSQAGL